MSGEALDILLKDVLKSPNTLEANLAKARANNVMSGESIVRNLGFLREMFPTEDMAKYLASWKRLNSSSITPMVSDQIQKVIQQLQDQKSSSSGKN